MSLFPTYFVDLIWDCSMSHTYIYALCWYAIFYGQMHSSLYTFDFRGGKIIDHQYEKCNFRITQFRFQLHKMKWWRIVQNRIVACVDIFTTNTPESMAIVAVMFIYSFYETDPTVVNCPVQIHQTTTNYHWNNRLTHSLTLIHAECIHIHAMQQQQIIKTPRESRRIYVYTNGTGLPCRKANEGKKKQTTTTTSIAVAFLVFIVAFIWRIKNGERS